jgi:hypothetical protein
MDPGIFHPPAQEGEALNEEDAPMDEEHEIKEEDQEMQQAPVRVAELPIEERLEKYRTLRDALWANCKEGDYLDAVDTVQKWCLV